MMNKEPIFIFFFICIASVLHSQVLTKELNMYRPGDVIVKQQVEYKNPGRGGENVIWDFGSLKNEDSKYSLVFTAVEDTTGHISGMEHQTRYYYCLRNDSLLLYGYENPTVKIMYSTPELLLIFPMERDTRIEGCFRGEGVYCDKLDVKTYGMSNSLVDAYGTLILPHGDTLKHVIRVRTTKIVSETILPVNDSLQETKNRSRNPEVFSSDSILKHLGSDSIVLKVDTYRWYATGYRYPIFETVSTENYRNNGKTPYFTTAFFYTPDGHEYLESDKKNIEKQLELTAVSASENSYFSDVQRSPIDLEITYRYYPNPVQSQLNFMLTISESAKVSFSLYNIDGMMQYHQKSRTFQSGTHIQKINMNRYPKGLYILHLQVNEKIFSEKILKR